MKFLIISLAGIGDTLFATPLIRELRTNFPEAQIDALVMWKGAKDLLDGNPHLNRVFQKNLITANKFEALRFLLRLRAEHYDVSFNTHPQSRRHYRMVAKLINARTRISHDYDRSGTVDRLLVNRRIPQDYNRHAIENNLDFLNLIDAKRTIQNHRYELFLSPNQLAWSEDFIQRNNLAGRILLGLHVGSGGTKNLALRRWPLANYIELISKIQSARPDISVLLFGGPQERADHQKLMSCIIGKAVVEVTSGDLKEAAAVLRKCHVFLSVDTALMHVAAAMNVLNQIVIETPTWNCVIQPYRNPFTLVPNPAVKGNNLKFYRYDGAGIRGSTRELVQCMESVTVPEVLKAVSNSLQSV